MKLNELATSLSALQAQLDKARGEILGRFADLESALQNVDLPDDAIAALSALSAAVQAQDDLVPDPVPEEPQVE